MLASDRTVWLITSFQSHTRATRSEIMQRVDTRFDMVADLPGTLGGGYVQVYRSRPVGTAR
jgi:hypothetical protein